MPSRTLLDSTLVESPAPGTSPPPQASVGAKTRSAARLAHVMQVKTPSLSIDRKRSVNEGGSQLQIAIRHGKVDISPSLRATVEQKVGRVGRFYEGMEWAEVRFAEEQNPRIAAREVCEVTMHGHGHIVRARAAAGDAFAAVDRVVDKLEHQITKLKGRLVDRSHPRRAASLDSAANAAGGEI